jgi:hypothetical protein
MPPAPKPAIEAQAPVTPGSQRYDPFVQIEDFSDEDAVLQAMASASSVEDASDPAEESDPTSYRISERG